MRCKVVHDAGAGCHRIAGVEPHARHDGGRADGLADVCQHVAAQAPLGKAPCLHDGLSVALGEHRQIGFLQSLWQHVPSRGSCLVQRDAQHAAQRAKQEHVGCAGVSGQRRGAFAGGKADLAGQVDARGTVAQNPRPGPELRLMPVSRRMVGQDRRGKRNEHVHLRAHCVPLPVRDPQGDGVQSAADAAVVTLVLHDEVSSVEQRACRKGPERLDPLPRFAADGQRNVHGGSFPASVPEPAWPSVPSRGRRQARARRRPGRRRRFR